MKVTQKLIEKILSSTSDPAVVVKMIEDYGKIYDGVRRIERQKKEAEQELEQKLRVFEKEIAELQGRCDHPELMFYGDASGNNDSYYECAICNLIKY